MRKVYEIETDQKSWQGRVIDQEIWIVLYDRHFKQVKKSEPVVWAITANDIKDALPANITGVTNTAIQRSLKRLAKSGHIELHELGYRRIGYSIKRFVA